MSCGDAAACHIGAWVEEELVGVATVTRQLPPGPPMRGFFHISRLAVRDPHDSVALIDRCVAFAAAHAGRTLWVRVPLDAVDIWRGCGFSIAGEPLRGRNGGAAVLMVRRIVPRRCRAYEAEKLSPKGAES
jgi:hypothetical protein